MDPRDQDEDGGFAGSGYGGYGDRTGPGAFNGGGFGNGPHEKGPEGLRLCPWERRAEFGFLNALYLTTREALAGPGRFFDRMPTRVGLTQPFLYALILGVTGAFLGWIWSLSGSSLQSLVSDNLSHFFRGPWGAFLAFVGSPISITVDVFLRAGLMHLMLMLLGGNQLGFEATFRVATYGKAASVIALLPFCGGIVALIWELAIDIIGLYRIHGTDPWRAMVAVLGPALICISSFGAALALVIVGMGLN
ncbi:MAG: YIP1 family protein [bacterium]|nr:YIP1 family protein [bacterium]